MFFLKALGAVLTAASPVGMGLVVSHRLTQRLCALETPHRFFRALRQELSYSMAPPPELLRALAVRPEYAGADYLGSALERIKHGEAFPEAWRAAVEDTALPLTGEDRMLIARAGERLGTSDLESQLSCLSHDIEQIGLTLDEARPRQQERAKLARTLGGLCGAFFVILII